MSTRKTVVLTTLDRPEPAAFEHRLEVGQHPLGLLPDAAADDLHGGRVERDLPRGEDEAVGDRGLAVGSDRLGGVGRDRFDGRCQSNME